MSVLINPYMLGGGIIKLTDALSAAGLMGNLKIALDAADLASYTAAATKWLDVSGNGEDFFLGTTAAAETQDPTFSGVAGSLNPPAFFNLVENTGSSCDRFTYDAANVTWMNNLHKTGAVWTQAAWVRSHDLNNRLNPLFCTCANQLTDVGMLFAIRDANDFPAILVVNNTASPLFTQQNATIIVTPAINTWFFIAGVLDLPNSTTRYVINDATETVAITPGVPSTAAATRTMCLGSIVGSATASPSNMDIGMAAFWDRALSFSELSTLYNLTRSRYGV